MEEEESRVLEPEVLPPEGEEPEPERGGFSKRLLAGFVVDAVDFALRGALGTKLGLPIGFIVGVFLGRYLGWRWGKTLMLGGVTGVYCAVPGTFLLPLGTVVALLSAFPSSKKPRIG